MRSLARVVVLVAFALAVATAAQAQEVTLSVAISMKEAVEELGKGFMASRPGVTLRYNFGSSGELQKQIEAGAPVDLFISAAQRQMDELEQKQLVVSTTRRVFARNVLTVIKPSDSKIDIVKPADLLEARVTKIVVGNPKTVPAGQYAEESLKALGLLDKLQPKLVFSENVRQALDYVARGEVDAGFVYATDAALLPGKVRLAFTVPTDAPVLYPIAPVAASTNPAGAQQFVAYVLSPPGQAILAKHGFAAP